LASVLSYAHGFRLHRSNSWISCKYGRGCSTLPALCRAAVCGEWSSSLIWLHNASDFLIWTAYLAIPVVLFRFAYRRREELPFRQVFWLFGLFIIACGTTHLMDIVLFYYPMYRLSGAVKLVTAAASWGTVMALVPIIPRALSMRTPEALEREIHVRERAEAEVRSLNAALEQRVLERTLELEAANRAKDELLVRERDARRVAEEASRAKDEFLATLSHELRTPLQAMVGWVSLLRGGRLDAATSAHALETIERSTRTQAQLIEDILDVSRIMVGKLPIHPEPMTVAPVLAAAVNSMLPAAQNCAIQIEQNLTIRFSFRAMPIACNKSC
jgi:signal transduction histidine kinase